MSANADDLGFLEETSPLVREIFHYWNNRRGTRAMPSRRDFDPVDLPKLLPGILLIDVVGVDEADVGQYRYRVVGTAEVANRGHDPTGRPVVEGFFGPSRTEALRSYEAVRRGRTFLYEPLEFTTGDHRQIDEYSILLPFSEDGRNVSQILVFSERRLRKDKGWRA
ncbi:MAG: PAS domain-containing protein [Inquilinus sp.]|nr:PAS domain-containing protein [Inquilinus sp.]